MTKKLLALIFVAFLCINTHAQQAEIQELLNKARQDNVSYKNANLYFGRKLIGVPYVAHTLEIYPKEQLIVNIKQVDCTTFVEQVLAMSLCVKNKTYTYEAFKKYLTELRYEKGGYVDYGYRNHYFTGWITSNTAKGFCKCTSTPTSVFSAIQNVNVNYMTTHISSYKMLKEDKAAQYPKIKAMEKRISGKKYRYIPKNKLRNTKAFRSAIKDGDIIVLLTNQKGLDTHHIGFAVWKADGLHLLNASSLRHQVVEEPKTLYKYLQEQKSMTGFRVVKCPL